MHKYRVTNIVTIASGFYFGVSKDFKHCIWDCFLTIFSKLIFTSKSNLPSINRKYHKHYNFLQITRIEAKIFLYLLIEKYFIKTLFLKDFYVINSPFSFTILVFDHVSE